MIKFIIRSEEITGTISNLAIIDIFKEVVSEYNYRVTKTNLNQLYFESFGDKPVSRQEAILYIDRGIFSIVSVEENTTFSLLYQISYLIDLIILFVFVAMAVFAGGIGYFGISLILIQFFYRVYKIRIQAKTMLAEIAEVAKSEAKYASHI